MTTQDLEKVRGWFAELPFYPPERYITHFAEKLAEERERCAKVAEDCYTGIGGTSIAAKIRSGA